MTINSIPLILGRGLVTEGLQSCKEKSPKSEISDGNSCPLCRHKASHSQIHSKWYVQCCMAKSSAWLKHPSLPNTPHLLTPREGSAYYSLTVLWSGLLFVCFCYIISAFCASSSQNTAFKILNSWQLCIANVIKAIESRKFSHFLLAQEDLFL